MIKLKPGFHMITTTAVIAAIAEKKNSAIAATIHSDHMKPLSSDRSNNLNNNRSISAIVVAAIAAEWFPYDR